MPDIPDGADEEDDGTGDHADATDDKYIRSCCGGVQGRALSTILCIGPYMELLHAVQKRHKEVRIVAEADDTVLNGEPSACLAAYNDKIKTQREHLGLEENIKKAMVISPKGNIDMMPPEMPGAPGSEVGVVSCFKAVGTYHGGDTDEQRRAIADAIEKRAMSKLAGLDAIDALANV